MNSPLTCAARTAIEAIRKEWTPTTTKFTGALLLRLARSSFELRAKADIGDDAFHQLEEEFDWIEMGTVRREE